MALSKTQSRRLGAILSVMFNEETPDIIVSEVIEGGYVEREGEKLKLTDKGNDERNRLSTLAGLNIKYQSERNAMKQKSPTDNSEPGIVNQKLP